MNSVFTHNKSASYFGALFFAIAAITKPIEGMAASQESADLKVEVGISTMRFKYEEFDYGRVINKEQGSLPGMSIKLGQRLAAWEWESSVSSYYGELPYTGEDTNQAPYTTRTDEAIGDISLRLGHWFGERYPVMPYAGIGYRRWDRDILPNSLAELFESYRWQYAWVGSKFFAYQDNTSSFLLDVGLLRPLQPELIYPDSTILHMVSKTGLRTMLTWSLKLKGKGSEHLVIEPWYEYWNMGRSPIKLNKSGSSYIAEPNSKTHNFGVNLRFAWTM